MIEFLFNITSINEEHSLGDTVIPGNEKNKYFLLFSNTDYNNNTTESLSYSFNKYVLNTYRSLYLYRIFIVHKSL